MKVTGLIQNPKERGRFMRFAVVGIIGAVVDFGIANLLIFLTGSSILVAGTISFICAVISNFLWNRYWTYPDSRSKNFARQLGQFGLVSVFGLGIRVILLYFIEDWLIGIASRVFSNHFFLSPDIIGKNMALAFTILVVMMWNFIANRYWTYNDVD